MGNVSRPQMAYCYNCNRLIDFSEVEYDGCPSCGKFARCNFERMDSYDAMWRVLENFGERLKKLEEDNG